LVGRPIGEILRAIAGLGEAALEEALRAQADEGGRLGEILLSKKAVTSEDVAKALALQLDLPYVAQVSLDAVDVELLRQVPINFAKQALILPLRLEGESVALLVADPLDTTVLDHARMLLQRNVSPHVSMGSIIVDAINGLMTGR
jgi:general secretion pathway protein E